MAARGQPCRSIHEPTVPAPLQESTTLVLVPGPNDIGLGCSLPHPGIPKTLAGPVLAAAPNAVLGSNPCRCVWGGVGICHVRPGRGKGSATGMPSRFGLAWPGSPRGQPRLPGPCLQASSPGSSLNPSPHAQLPTHPPNPHPQAAPREVRRGHCARRVPSPAPGLQRHPAAAGTLTLCQRRRHHGAAGPSLSLPAGSPGLPCWRRLGGVGRGRGSGDGASQMHGDVPHLRRTPAFRVRACSEQAGGGPRPWRGGAGRAWPGVRAARAGPAACFMPELST